MPGDARSVGLDAEGSGWYIRMFGWKPHGRGSARATGGKNVPHKKSAKKRLKQDEKLQLRNRGIRSRMLTAIKVANAAPAEDRPEAVKRAVSAIDRAVKAGVIKKATGSRKKSSLMKRTSSDA